MLAWYVCTECTVRSLLWTLYVGVYYYVLYGVRSTQYGMERYGFWIVLR